MQTKMKTSDYFANKKCKICGDNVSGVNYGVLTCESCKIFFHRNQSKNFHCTKVNDCLIDITTRKNCASCRLKKCLFVGMLKTYNQKRLLQSHDSSIKSILESNHETFKKTRIRKSSNAALELSLCEQDRIAQVQKAIACAFEDESKLEVIGVTNNMIAIGELNWPDMYARKVVKFAKSMSALAELSATDQLTILRNSIMEILFVRISFAIDLENNGYPIVQNEPTKHVLFVRFNMRPGKNKFLQFLHPEFDNDTVIRDLVLAQLLFQSHSNVSCPEFIRYHHILYKTLLSRYMLSKYRCKKRAELKYSQLMNVLSHMPAYKEHFLRRCQEVNLQQLPEIMVEVIPTLPK